MRVTYAGKSEYCYDNSLYMCLLASGASEATLPQPGFLECLTRMPFGAFYLRLPGAPLFFASSAAVSPDEGLGSALAALGWACEEWHGGDARDRDEAVSRLRAAVGRGTVLLGPVDLGFLSYNPRAEQLRGGDHFIAALAIEGEQVLLHDPYGFPYAALDLPTLLDAWQADTVDYKRGPFTMRFGFRPDAPTTRADAIQRTLPHIHEALTADPGDPVALGGQRALLTLVDDLRGEVSPSLAEMLVWFSLPIGARRRLDAARFLAEAGHPELADIFDRQARLYGAALSLARREAWGEVAGCFERFAALELEAAVASARLIAR